MEPERRKTYKYCLVPGCGRASDSSKLFISLPQHDTGLREKWLQSVGVKPDHYSRKSNLTICQDHFDLPKDMENYMEFAMLGKVKRVIIRKDHYPFERKKKKEQFYHSKQLEISQPIIATIPTLYNGGPPMKDETCYIKIDPPPVKWKTYLPSFTGKHTTHSNNKKHKNGFDRKKTDWKKSK